MDNNLLNEVDKLNGTLDRFDKMYNQQQNNNTTTTTDNNVITPPNNNTNMFDGIMFDIFLSIFIIIIRQFLAIKFDEPGIKKIGYALALIRPYFI